MYWHPILLGLRSCNEVVCGDDLERLTDMVPRLAKIPNAWDQRFEKMYLEWQNEWQSDWTCCFMDFKHELCGLVSFSTPHVSDRKIQDWVASTRCPAPYRTHKFPSLGISKYLCLSTAMLWYQDLWGENRSLHTERLVCQEDGHPC